MYTKHFQSNRHRTVYVVVSIRRYQEKSGKYQANPELNRRCYTVAAAFLLVANLVTFPSNNTKLKEHVPLSRAQGHHSPNHGLFPHHPVGRPIRDVQHNNQLPQSRRRVTQQSVNMAQVHHVNALVEPHQNIQLELSQAQCSPTIGRDEKRHQALMYVQ